VVNNTVEILISKYRFFVVKVYVLTTRMGGEECGAGTNET
jgi:hypothetical protein